MHVEYLARELARLVDLTVHCQGADRAGRGRAPAVGAAGRRQPGAADDLHRPVHDRRGRRRPTWCTRTPGTPTWPATWRRMLYGVPHVVTTHSLEPLRPWKAEQLGGGYALSSWCERTAVEAAAAVVAVSDGMRADVLAAYPAVPPDRVRVIRNGIDTDEYAPDPGTDVLDRYGVDPDRPYVIFVGRVTRQKGLPVLLRAADRLDPGAQLVLCAGQADTPELAAEVDGLVATLTASPVRGALDLRHAGQARGDPVALARHGVRLPVGVRAAGHREPGGDGLRRRRGGLPGRRHPRGGGRRRDRPAGAARRPGRAGRRAERRWSRPGQGGGDGPAGRKRAMAEFGWATIAAQTAALYRELTA